MRGDALRLPLGDETVDLICTSPPYFALRSYSDGGEHCEGQIGSEPTPTAFLEALWAVTAECWRVLKPSGSLFVNLGDKYAGTGGGNGQTGLGGAKPTGPTDARSMPTNNTKQTSGFVRRKSLMNLPARYVIGCTDGEADPDGIGWVQRAEIVWSKPNGMPEPVRDRGRRSHEQWYHLTKGERYYHDHPGILSIGGPATQPTNGSVFGGTKAIDAPDLIGSAGRTHGMNTYGEKMRPQTKRALAIAAEHGLTDAHRQALRARGLGDDTKSAVVRNGTGKNDAETLRLAAEAERVLGSYAREFTMSDPAKGKVPNSVWPLPDFDDDWLPASVLDMLSHPDDSDTSWTIPTSPLVVPEWLDVDHFAAFPTEWPRRIISGWCPPDGVVLDPFGGTGTTAMVARALGRYGVSLDLSADYLRLARWRIWQSGQAAKVAARSDRDRQGVLL